MKLTVGLAAACMLLVAAEGKNLKKSDSPLEGVWKVHELKVNGNELEDAKGSKFTFKGSKLARQTPEGEETYSFKLFPDKKPAELDFVPDQGDNKGKTLKGVYELKDGDLKVCLSLDPDAKRPGGFGGKDAEENVLLILKRDKP